MSRLRSNSRVRNASDHTSSGTHFGFSKGGMGNSDPRNPTISVLSSGTPNATDATITWTTDFLADTQVFWGLTTAYAGATSPLMDFTMVTSHSRQITGLVTATTYHYKVLSRTLGGGYAFSADSTFVTA